MYISIPSVTHVPVPGLTWVDAHSHTLGLVPHASNVVLHSLSLGHAVPTVSVDKVVLVLMKHYQIECAYSNVLLVKLCMFNKYNVIVLFVKFCYIYCKNVI